LTIQYIGAVHSGHASLETSSTPYRCRTPRDGPNLHDADRRRLFWEVSRLRKIALQAHELDILLTDERMPGRDVQSKQDRFQQGRAETITMGL